MKLAPEGNIIIYPLSFCWVVCIIFSSVYNSDGLYIFLTVLSILLIFCINFFRDPNRIIPKQENYVLSPADGKIIKIIEKNNKASNENLCLVPFFKKAERIAITKSSLLGSILFFCYSSYINTLITLC